MQQGKKLLRGLFAHASSSWIGLKPRHALYFAFNGFWNCKESDGKETKKHDFGKSVFIFNSQKIVWACLTILCGWLLKGLKIASIK